MLFNVAAKEKYRKGRSGKNLMDHVIKYAPKMGISLFRLQALITHLMRRDFMKARDLKRQAV